MNKQKKAIIAAVVIAFLLIAAAFIAKARMVPDPHRYDAFAQCLSAHGAVMYGASWCTHCQATKDAFGNSFQYVSYVECVSNPTLCAQKGIDAYPTWLIGTSSKVEGFDGNTFRYLSQASGCALPE